EAWAADARTKIRTKRRTVDDAIADFRAEMDQRVERNECRMETARNAENALRKLHADALDLALSALTERRCSELYTAIVDSGIAAGTQHRFLRTAHAFGEWMVKRHFMKANAWANVERVGQRDDSRDVVLREDEADKFRDVAVKLAH